MFPSEERGETKTQQELQNSATQNTIYFRENFKAPYFFLKLIGV